MCNKFLFYYMIDSVKIDVYYPGLNNRSSFINDCLFKGVTMAAAQYLCYPFDVIAPRMHTSFVKFVYEEKELDNILAIDSEAVSECTRDAFLSYMEKAPGNANMILPEYVATPDLNPSNVSAWCERLRKESSSTKIKVESFECDETSSWMKFSYNTDVFYGRCNKGDSSEYLLVSLPGYGAEWNDLSAYAEVGCDILQLSPLGYNTPYGYDDQKRIRGAWPVLYDTVCEIEGDAGYEKWFFEVALAVNAIKKGNQKLIFVGTSQGGGAALVLSSIFNDCTAMCASEMPFLIGFSGVNYKKVRKFIASQMNNFNKFIYDFYAKEKLFVVDPLSHIERINCRVLLVAGELDDECPKEDIIGLYRELKTKKQYVELRGHGHGYTKEFENLAKKHIKAVTGGQDEGC